jgi:hypothetical protein
MSLATSLGTGGTTWAVVPMGATSGPNRFWQLFLLAAGQQDWRLDTPPDIATNGAPAIAAQPGSSLVIGVRPSLYLAFSPVSRTTNDGRAWAASAPAAGLASVPDALAATPAGTLLALSLTGQVSVLSAPGTRWSVLTSEPALAKTPAGRRCGLAGLTAVAYLAAATPVVAGGCTKPGAAGIFAQSNGSWHSLSPALAAVPGGGMVSVLRLAATQAGLVTLLQVGAGPASKIVAAWLDQHGHWTVSAPFALAGRAVLGTSLNASGGLAVSLANRHAYTIAAASHGWQATPLLPPGESVTIAQPPGSRTEALAAAGGRLTVWRLGPSATNWTKAQVIKVPIQYGSSS